MADIFNNVTNYCKPILQKAIVNTLDLAKIMIPIIIFLKLVQELNLVYYLVYPFNPIMGLVGLPAIYSLVWIGAILNNNYTALFLTLALFSADPLNYEQMTTLAVLCLIAHSIITEAIIMSKFNVNAYFITLMRFVSAIILAYIVHISFSYFNVGQDIVTNSIFSVTTTPSATFVDYYNIQGFAGNYSDWSLSILQWAYNQLVFLLLIFIVILFLFFVVQFIKDIKLANLLVKIVNPLTATIGIRRNNGLILLLCYVVGLSYGFGLLKDEYQNNKFFRGEQSFKILLFIAISHAIIEDSLLFIILGANAWVIVVGRTLSSFIIAYVVAKVLSSNRRNHRKNSFFYKAN